MISHPNTNSKWWSKKEYFIFVPSYNFTWTIPEAKDFVKKCSVRCYWVLAAPWCPYLYKCDYWQWKTYAQSRENNEIFNTFQECLEKYEKWFDEKWRKIVKEDFNRSISFYEKSIKSQKKFLKKMKSDLKLFESL